MSGRHAPGDVTVEQALEDMAPTLQNSMEQFRLKGKRAVLPVLVSV